MRPQKVNDEKMMDALLSVIREKGYDGASLNDLSEASGLKKASLYHRFPKGKQAMTMAVLDFVDNWITENIYNILCNDSMNPQDRLTIVLKNIKQLYGNGGKSCLLRSLTTESGLELFAKQIKKSMLQWIVAFQYLGKSFGTSEQMSKKLAYESLIEIQGALIVSKGLNSYKPFQDTIQSIRNKYLLHDV